MSFPEELTYKPTLECVGVKKGKRKVEDGKKLSRQRDV